MILNKLELNHLYPYSHFYTRVELCKLQILIILLILLKRSLGRILIMLKILSMSIPLEQNRLMLTFFGTDPDLYSIRESVSLNY